MGTVFRPEDITRGRKRIIEEAVRDLSPGIKEATVRILKPWVGKEAEERLVNLLQRMKEKQRELKLEGK